MTVRNLCLTFALCAITSGIVSAQATPTVLIDIDHRPAQTLDGDWHYIVDPYASGLYSFHREIKKNGFFQDLDSTKATTGPIEYDFAKSPTLKVPGDWNTQTDRLYYYEGPLWYERKFDAAPTPGTRVFLHIGAANYRAKLWINGQHVCDHEGGFTPFDCEVTSVLKSGQNSAVINVDNTRIEDGVPTLNTDWWNYGGLTREVSLVTVPETFIDDYDLHLSRKDHKTIEGYVHLDHAAAGSKVNLTLPGLDVNLNANTDAAGRATFSFIPAKLRPWEPAFPNLNTVQISSGSDKLTDYVGFRTVEVEGSKILLNGKPIFLRGICIHAEAPIRGGRAYSEKDVDTLLGWVKDLGGNFVRLAHYPHDERMTRAADRMGILVWSEIPTYWALQFDNPAVLAKAQQQLHEEQRRDRNKASIILWSVANETPNNPVRTKFLTTLANSAREYDPTRLVTAALLVHGDSADPNVKVIDDPLGAALDVIGSNEYIGWYEKTPEDAANTTWKIAYDKPLIMSEFGGEAKTGLHGGDHDRWTEEYQANIFRNQLIMLNKIPQLRGMSPWLLMDFRSPVRLLPGIQDDFNRKGLVAPDGTKKKAFFVLQQAYKENGVGKPE